MLQKYYELIDKAPEKGYTRANKKGDLAWALSQEGGIRRTKRRNRQAGMPALAGLVLACPKGFARE
jgi:hypothetical protein